MDFDLLMPTSAAEAIALMQENPNARYLAGGTDLVPNLRRGIGAPDILIGLDGVEDLKGISEGGDYLTLGAGVTLAELEGSGLSGRYGALSAAVDIAGPALRQAATIGGNLCLDTRCIFYNQSKWWRNANQYCLKLDGDTCHVAPKGQRCHAAFSGDLAPALMVLGAEVRVVGPNADGWKPISDLYHEDGLAHLTLAPGDLLVAVRLPVVSRDLRSGYLKSRLRKAVDFPLAGVAVALRREGDAITDLRVGVTGTNPRPLLFDGLVGGMDQGPNDDALSAITKEIGQMIKPMRTTNLPGLYRRQMVTVLTRRLITDLYDAGDRKE